MRVRWAGWVSVFGWMDLWVGLEWVGIGWACCDGVLFDEEWVCELRTPWTGIADIEMISVFLGRELRVRFSGDVISELGLLAFELAGLITWFDPICYAIFLVLVGG